jgi:predicted RNA-binding Zn-ribbon protein involved in translation (DUF1610 family)
MRGYRMAPTDHDVATLFRCHTQIQESMRLLPEGFDSGFCAALGFPPVVNIGGVSGLTYHSLCAELGRGYLARWGHLPALPIAGAVLACEIVHELCAVVSVDRVTPDGFDLSAVLVNLEREALALQNAAPSADGEGALQTANIVTTTAEQSATSETREGNKRAQLAEAMLCVRDHPKWSDRKIAKAVKVAASTLSRSRVYQAAAAMARTDKAGAKRGHNIVDNTGLHDVQAIAPGVGDQIPGSRYYRGKCPECGTETRVEVRELAETMPCEKCQ